MNARDLLAERLAKPVTEAPLNQYTVRPRRGRRRALDRHQRAARDLLAGLDARPDAQCRPRDPAARGVRGALRDRGPRERRDRRGRRAGQEPVHRRLARSSSTACSVASPRSSPPSPDRDDRRRAGPSRRRPPTSPSLQAIEAAADRPCSTTVVDTSVSGSNADTGEDPGRLSLASCSWWGSRVVGFALTVSRLSRASSHLEQLAVDAPHGRRGLGSQPSSSGVCRSGPPPQRAVVPGDLRTFADVPWNADHFYARLGFA